MPLEALPQVPSQEELDRPETTINVVPPPSEGAVDRRLSANQSPVPDVDPRDFAWADDDGYEAEALRELPTLPELGTAYANIAIAASQIGYREGYVGGSWDNDTAFGLWYPMNRVAWCAIFQSWSASAAGVPPETIPKHCWTPGGKDWFAARERIYRTPQAGDLMYVYYRTLDPPRIGHVGLVEKVLPDNEIQTIEGNTNDGGGSQGNGVYRLTRKVTTSMYFGRPDYKPISPPGDDDMTPEQAIQLARVEALVAGAVGRGQTSFPGTIQTILSAIQATFNRVGSLKLTIVGVGADGAADPEQPERLLVGAGEVKVIPDDSIRAELENGGLASVAYVSQATYDLLRP